MKKPLISCIMPTTGSRKRFVERSIRYFNAQDYPNKELIIIADEDTSILGEAVPTQENIIYTDIFCERQLTIGMKRNLAVSLAQGAIICHWDDDDYYGPQRLSRQVEPLVGHRGLVASAMKMSLLLNACDGTLWECSAQMNAAYFLYGVRAGTLMYLKSYWHHASNYINQSRGEDVAFLSSLFSHGLQVARVDDPASYICVRHESNVTADLDVSGWEQAPLDRYLSAEDQAFYRQFASEKSRC